VDDDDLDTLGVGGTIYSPFSLEPLKNLGLRPQKATSLVLPSLL